MATRPTVTNQAVCCVLLENSARLPVTDGASPAGDVTSSGDTNA